MRKKKKTVKNKNELPATSGKKRIVKKRAPRTHNMSTWTESEYFGKIRACLRNGFRYYKPMMYALDKASRPSQSLNKKLKKEYQCAHCKQWFPRKEVEIDHKIECGSLRNFEDIVPFIKRLSAENVEDYQILCKPDHKVKGAIYKLGISQEEQDKLIQEFQKGKKNE